MKKLFIIPLFAIALTSCSTNGNPIESKVFCFDTMVEVKLYDGNKDNIKDIEDILKTYSKLSDNYLASDVNNVYTINNTNDEVTIDERLYKLLQTSFSVKDAGASYFNPFCGSLAKKWKDVLAKGETLSSEVINAELGKISSSSLEFKANNVVQRSGEAEIDLGGIAKGYALDIVKDYLKNNNSKQYLINGGSSSLLLGEKNTKDGLYTIGLKDLNNAYLKLKNCFISTSSISEQGVKIGDVTYSHIINPNTGSAINENDAVIVISDNGALGDALSTSMMNNTIDEIKAIETQYNVQTIVIKNNEVIYQNPGIEVSYH